jgi:hypothetical protein
VAFRTLTLENTVITTGQGGNGGAGGNGGSGGDGGAGQGGHSIGIYGGFFPAIDAATATFVLGPAGTGPNAIRANIHRP